MVDGMSSGDFDRTVLELPAALLAKVRKVLDVRGRGSVVESR